VTFHTGPSTDGAGPSEHRGPFGVAATDGRDGAAIEAIDREHSHSASPIACNASGSLTQCAGVVDGNVTATLKAYGASAMTQDSPP
jgi:hypothetical protein